MQLCEKKCLYRALVQFVQPQQDQTTGKVHTPANLGYVSTKDTGLLNQYLNLDIVKNKFPANLNLYMASLKMQALMLLQKMFLYYMLLKH